MNLKQTKKNNVSCNNCGSLTHMFKNCTEPIRSYGIILLQLDFDATLRDIIINKLCDNGVNINYENDNKQINVNDYSDMEIFSLMKNSIKMLLIQRKHSVGFIEFVRGRYKINNVEGIIFLFKQMTQYEIDLIKLKSFDKIWDYLWGINKEHVAHFNDYSTSKNKFEKLKLDSTEYLNLDFYTTNIKPDYMHPEWGFPKGRKNNSNEDNKEAAKREFMEETNYTEDNYVILDNIGPIEESLIGTNGINYKHVYYVAIAKNIDNPYINDDNVNQIDEIGDINFFLYEDAVKIIRPYHTDKQKIVLEIYMFMMNKIIECVRG